MSIENCSEIDVSINGTDFGYTLPNFKHHNGFYSSDRESLLEGMLHSNTIFPYKKLTIKLAVAGPPYVTLLSHVQITEDKEVAVVHMDYGLISISLTRIPLNSSFIFL